MSRSGVRRTTAAVAVGAAVIAASGLTAGEANAKPSPDLSPGVTTAKHSIDAGKVKTGATLPAGVPKKGSYAFLLKLNATSTLRTYDLKKSQGTSTADAKSAAKTQGAAIARVQNQVAAALPAKTAQLYRTHAALAGLAVQTDVKNYGALTRIPGVSAVYPIAPKSTSNAYAVPLQGAPEAWKAYGDLGQNSTVAIIDTGVDYTHADFGGAGTVAAYDTAKAALGASPDFPSAKVVGGYDFAGDSYQADPNSPDYDPTPTPDPYPLDCNSHGSHVAGTVAGYGENADGSTYTGAYNKKTPFDTMRIGPGVAPEAKLYAYRVFGCTGSTNIIGEAIDRALDPNNDGDPSDHVDVVNMSLGSDFGSPNDGDSIVTNDAAAAGIVMAVASGNAGDVNDIGGSPGNAPRALTVAASVDASAVVDALNVTAPAGIAGKYAAERSVAYDYVNDPDLSGTVAQVKDPGNLDGCDPLSTADAAAVNGKIAFVEWTDLGTRRCGSVARSANLVAAGATGFIFGDDSESFSAGITGSATIPGVLLAKSGADAIRAQLAAGTPVTIGSTTSNGFAQIDPSLNDTLTDFSSRGIGDLGDVKPDVTAVGASVFSAGSGTGNQGLNDSGTSMATPMVAGTAALVKSQNPNWNAQQVKADIMNTATTDLYTGTDHTGTKFAPNRVGSGRIDIKKAVDNHVVAYTTDGGADGTDNGAVSASFGPIAVAAGTTDTQTRTITVQNLGNTATTYSTSFVSRSSVPGATFSVSPDTITVDPRSKTTVTLTLSLDASKLTKTIDPTMERAQGTSYGTLPRVYKADVSGIVVFKSDAQGVPNLRVPAYAAPRPASTMTQASSVTLPDGAVQTAILPLTGSGVNQGSGKNAVQSLVAGFELQATSGVAPDCSATVTSLCIDASVPEEKSSDLKYVGATSNAPQLAAIGDDALTSTDGLAYFSVTTQGPWRTAASQNEFDIYMDTTGDGKADFVTFNTRLPVGTDQTDVLVAETIDLANGTIADLEPINSAFGDTDTALLDSDTMVLPVAPAALGLTPATSRITYSVQSFSPFLVGGTGPVDEVGSVANDNTITDGLSFDVANPGISLAGSYDGDTNPLLYRDSPGSILQLRRDAAAYAKDKALGALVIHFQNALGNKAQVVSLSKNTSATSLSLAPNPAVIGSTVTATVAVTGDAGPATGDVVISKDGTTVGTATLGADGTGTATFKATAASAGDYVATFAGDDSYTGSASAPVTLAVTKAASATSLTFSPNPVTVNQSTTATVAVNGEAGTATGTVTLKRGTTTVGTATLVGGTAAFTGIKPTSVGTASYTASYAGDTSYLGSTSAAVTLTVKQATPTVKLSLAKTSIKVKTKVAFTVTVTGTSGTPTGSVTVVNSKGTKLATFTLSGGKGTGTIYGDRVGSFVLSAQYAGNATYVKTTSPTVTLTVTK